MVHDTIASHLFAMVTIRETRAAIKIAPHLIAPGRQKKSSKRKDRFLKLFQIQNWATTSAKACSGMAAGKCECIYIIFWRKAWRQEGQQKKPLLSSKNIKDETDLQKIHGLDC